jgi:hypothetical protein
VALTASALVWLNAVQNRELHSTSYFRVLHQKIIYINRYLQMPASYIAAVHFSYTCLHARTHAQCLFFCEHTPCCCKFKTIAVFPLLELYPFCYLEHFFLGFCPSSKLQIKSQRFGSRSLLQLSGKGQNPYLLSLLVELVWDLKTEAESSFRNIDILFVIQTMDRVQRKRFTDYNTPFSDTFRLQVLGLRICLAGKQMSVQV